MTRKSIQITRQGGLEARSTAELVQVAVKFDSRVYIESGTKKVNAKSIMGMMSLELEHGDVIVVSADGQDEEQAIREIERFLIGA
ncbi:MAG: HPr family phosphocarrier protein [Lachnospiraceae bacterium]|nr:HPr family phosphocarrier protein [Lachnospiraceae bacterium]